MSREYDILINEKETEIMRLSLKTLKEIYMVEVDYHMKNNNIGDARGFLDRMDIIDEVMLKLISH